MSRHTLSLMTKRVQPLPRRADLIPESGTLLSIATVSRFPLRARLPGPQYITDRMKQEISLYMNPRLRLLQIPLLRHLENLTENQVGQSVKPVSTIQGATIQRNILHSGLSLGGQSRGRLLVAAITGQSNTA